MAFYIRKSIKLGPIRLNLSKSGLGMSTGVKGARIGITPQGKKYLHLGRGGIYYRETLPENRSDAGISWGVAFLIAMGALFLIGRIIAN
jgi:hypothetical protein